MEGKAIKEESVNVGSPCSPLSLPSGKENRRVGSPLSLTNSEILTRSRTKVLTKENHHHHQHPHHHRMTESPKSVGEIRSPSPINSSSGVSVNLTVSKGFLHHQHHFSSPHSTTTTTSSGSAVPSSTSGSGSIINGSLSGRRSPQISPPVNSRDSRDSREARESRDSREARESRESRDPRDLRESRDGGTSTGRTPTSSSSSNTPGSGSGSSGNSMGHSSSLGGNSRLLVKIKRFLGTLLHFGCDISPDVGERVRTLVFSLVSGHLSIEEFHHTLQEVTSFPLRPFVLPFLRAHLPLLQREINHSARIAKQSPLSYVQTHEQVIIDTGSSPGEPCDIFHSEASDLSLPSKRKASDSFYENGEVEFSGYTSTPKRHHGSGSLFSPPFFLGPSPTSEFREYYSASGYIGIPLTSSGSHHPTRESHHHDISLSMATSSTQSQTQSTQNQQSQPGTPSNSNANLHSNGINGQRGPEDEWKNIHVMLNCILSMVEKTKRALGILQTRTHSDPDGGGCGGSSSGSWLRRPPSMSMWSNSGVGVGMGIPLESSEDIKRQVAEMMAQAFRATEDRVSEVKRRAEEAVQEVKRQALLELKRAVAAAEARACDAVASERARLERVLIESRRNPGDAGAPSGTAASIIVGVGAPATPSEAEACWNCGRKAHETCSGCNTARYCSAFCQHKDWENHHTVCGSGGGSASRSGSGGGTSDRDRASSASVGGNGSGPSEPKHPHHPHVHETNSNSNSPPINVANPSPEHNSPGPIN